MNKNCIFFFFGQSAIVIFCLVYILISWDLKKYTNKKYAQNIAFKTFCLTGRILGLNIQYFVIFANILKMQQQKICSEHSIHGYHLRRFGITECILGWNIIYFVLFAQIIKDTTTTKFSEHRIYGYHLGRFSLTKCILVINAIFWYNLPRSWREKQIQNINYSYGHGLGQLFLGVHNCS